MSFSAETAEQVLAACHRHCCLCHRFAGTKMEIHHITPLEQGGSDTEENAIPLCFDCHAEVAAYNPKHPKGRRFAAAELRKHRDQWFAICRNPPWSAAANSAPMRLPLPAVLNDRILGVLRVDDRRPAQALAEAFARLDRAQRKALAKWVFDGLLAEDEETRWKLALLVEELLLWDPDIVSPQVIEKMSADSCFAVRSSAAMCYYYLARLAPASVPLDILADLASCREDWYVYTPAVSALLRLARARPVVMSIFERDLWDRDKDVREHATGAIRRLAQTEPELVPMELLTRMASSDDPFVKDTGQKALALRKAVGEKPYRDYSPF